MCFSLHNEWCAASEYKCVSVFIMNGVLPVSINVFQSS